MSIEHRSETTPRPAHETGSQVLRFGVYSFHLAKLELSRSGHALRLQAQPARLLRLLLLHAGDLVTRDAICQTLWEDGTNVDFEIAVNRCVRQIRIALDDQIDAPRYVKTIPRLGYSFIAATTSDLPKSPQRAPVGRDSAEEVSIVILPFTNLSGHLHDEYFSDGLAEELTNVLAQVNGLRVIARTSAFVYKGRNEDVRRIGEALGVNNVLEGSVRRSGEHLRVTVQLIRASDGAHRLSKRYDYEISDVFAMQDEISADVLHQLRLHLISARPTTSSVEAYRAQLEGRFHWNRYSRTGFTKALECFESAKKLDPRYALAYTGIAQSTLGLVKEAGASALELLPQAAIAARRALELDDADAEAHACMGEIAILLDYDWEKAEKHLETALELNPSTYVRSVYAIYYLIPQGRTSEALAQSERVIANDPLNVVGHQLRAAALMFARDYAAAVQSCSRVLELNEIFPRGLQLMALLKGFQGLHNEALHWAYQLIHVMGRSYLSLHALGMVHAVAGETELAHSVLMELVSLPEIDQRLPSAVALINVVQGNFDEAIVWCRKAIDHREPSVLWVHMLPRGSSLRSDERFQKLLALMHLPSDAKMKAR